MNVEKWFEKGTSFKIKELRYLKPPQLPYFLYTNVVNKRGADLVINIIENNISIERYSKSNSEKDVEDIKKVNKFFEDNFYDYEVVTEWLNDENLYGTFWTLSPIVEKIRSERK